MKTFFNFFLTKAESGENKKILTKKRGETYLLKPEKLSKKRSKIKNFHKYLQILFYTPLSNMGNMLSQGIKIFLTRV